MAQRPILVAACSVLAVSVLPVIVLSLMLMHPHAVRPIDELVAIRTIDEAISHMKAAALNGEAVDWVSARSAALRTFETAKSRGSLEAAMTELVQSLGDGHSLYVRAEQLQAMRAEASDGESSKLAQVDEHPAGIPTVRLFSFAVLNTKRAAAQAAELEEQLQRSLRAGSCGAIVDLRHDGGGNMWPMLAGLSPLLPRGTLFHFVDRTQSRRSVVLDARSLRLDGRQMVTTLSEGSSGQPMPVAILIGERTASSGEIVAIALRANPRSVLIGSRSAGLTTGNVLFELADGSAIAVTTTRLVTQHGDPVSGPLRPDIDVNASFVTDSALNAARHWLKNTCHAPTRDS